MLLPLLLILFAGANVYYYKKIIFAFQCVAIPISNK